MTGPWQQARDIAVIAAGVPFVTERMRSRMLMAASTKITPMRWYLLAALAAICALVASTGARAEDPGQAKKEKKMTKTESGLEYRDVKEGTGAKPNSGQTCSVHYTGWL
jgi:hypothetical protein